MPYVLMFHSISPYTRDPDGVTVSPERFEQQMRWLHRRGLRGTSVEELVANSSNGSADRLVGLTFDDGFEDFITYALPILERYGFIGTAFVLAGRLGEYNAWNPGAPRKPLMTADQVRYIADRGIEVGSHGLRHVSLPSSDAAIVAAEVRRSQEILHEITNQTVRGFCYPYGDVDSRGLEAVRTAGYDYGCAIWPSALTGRHALPRTYINDRDGSLRLHAKRCHHRIPVGRRRDRGIRKLARNVARQLTSWRDAPWPR